MKHLVFAQVTSVFVRCRRGFPRLAQSSCASATPEYAILTFAVVATLILSVGSIGYRAADVLQAFSYDTHDRREIATSLDEFTVSESSNLPQAAERMPSESEWTMWLQLVTVPITGAWLLLRFKSRRASKKPRPLEVVSHRAESKRVFEKRQQILRVISNHKDAFLQGNLGVWHFVTRDPITITPDQSVETARKIMEEHNVDHLLVCEADRTLLGLISKHYLKRNRFRKVADAMAVNPLFVAPNAMLNPTITYMLSEGISCVAVVENGKAVGALTTTDIQLTLQAAFQLLATIASEERSPDLVSVFGTNREMP